MSIDISIIIVNWNTRQITLDCLNSIYKKLTKIKFEIIVVDNGSTDDSVPKINQFQKKNSNLIFIKNKNNQGFSKANNIGAKKASGQYYFFLNSDTKLLDNSLSKMLSYYKKYQNNIGIIAPQLLNPDKTIQNSVFPPQTLQNAISEYYFNHKDRFSSYSPKVISTVNAVSGAALLISQKLFKKINGWNEKYFFYFEDLDMCRTIRKHKLKIIYYPDCKIIHYGGYSGKSNNLNQWKKMTKSSRLYHGTIKYLLLSFILWLPQKIKRFAAQ